MKNLIFFWLIGAVLLTTSCKNEKSYQLSVNNHSEDVSEISLVNILLGIDTTLTSDANNVFNFNTTFAGPSLLDVKIGNRVSQIYVDNGIQTSLSIDSAGALIIPDTDTNNKTLSEFSSLSRNMSRSLNPSTYYKAPLDSFKILMADRFQPLDSFLVAHEGEDTYTYIKNNLAALKSSDVNIYPNYYNYLNKDSIEFPESFTKNTYGLDMEDENLLLSDATRNSLSSMASRGVEFEEGMTMDDYVKKSIAYANDNVKNPITKNHLIFKQLSDRINYGGGIDGIEDEVESLLSSTDNAYYHNSMNKLKAEWANLRAGLDAPGFDAVDRDGNTVALSDLKGKAVYIDVWATWCGPCIAEIPSLKEVENDYHDANITFVSVSIDEQSDAEKWKKFVEEKELGGTQLMAENAWKSDIASGYNIKGIPRFILIDKDGKIVKADAPRPSSSEIRGLLDNYKG